MLERDYIMRLLREFAEALELLLKKDVRKQREEIQKMYDQYVGPYAFYHTAPMSEVMDSFTHFPPEQRLKRMEMLAELYYAEASMSLGPTRHEMYRRAYALYDMVTRHDKTYDLTRLTKMQTAKQNMADEAVQP